MSHRRCGIFPIVLPILPRPPYYPHPTPQPEQAEYPLVKAACHYTVVDVNVHARLTQTYVSTAKKAQEVKYIFPLPSNAAVCAFNAVIDDSRTIHGIVKQKDEAKRDYDKAVAEGKTAGLLDQHSADVFEVSLGNLKPGQKIDVNISYVSIVSHDGKLDSLRLTLPLSIAPNYGKPPASLGEKFNQIRGTSKPFELTMAFSMTSNISSITSQTHPIGLSLGTLSPDSEGAFDSTKAHVSLNTGDMLDKDVVIVLKSDKLDHPRCVVERSVRQDETSDAVALTLVPRFNLPPLPAQEYIFLIDRSGSMGGGRIAAVRTALQIMLRSLPSRGSRFNLVSFGSDCDLLWPASVEYSAESVKEAAAHVDGMEANYGGTEIRLALKTAFDSRPKDKRTEPTMVLLLTDGEAWDVAGVIKETEEAVAESKGALRVFVLGVGDQVSTNMCDSIARAGHGVASYVGEQEKPDAKLMNMLKAARGGAITDISVDWGIPLESEDAVDDFEVVERDDAMNVDPKPAPPVPVKPISLFDTSSTLETDTKLGPEDVPVDLPPVPRIQQSNTSKMGALYPGFRTSLFAIIRQPAPSAPTPTKVTVSGKVLGAPVSLEVPVTSAIRIAVPAGEKPVDLLHVLAARAFVQTLEDESNKTALVKAQITRLGTTYGIASSQTSFVAIDEKGEKIDQPRAVEQPEEPEFGRASSMAPMVMLSATRGFNTVGGGGGPRNGPVPRLARAGGGPQRLAMAAAPPPPPVMMAAPAAPGAAYGSAASAYSAAPRMRAKAGGPPRGSAAPKMKRNLVSDGLDDEGGTTSTHTGPPTVEVLARQQQFDGSFIAAQDFYNSLGAASASSALPSSVSALSGPSDAVRANVWATIVALVYLQKKFADDEDSWALLADKARDYVLQILTSDAGVDDAKANALVVEWIDAAKKVLA
ncbi:VIT-domain-containing protein [Auricularia subglabra TFB-10046 SS5]|nr:VIT-domain-containing protein [Auricularia subglabra TFB-10046 SS5]